LKELETSCDLAFDGFKAQIALTLAGRTHSGQAVVGGKTLLSFMFPYIRGLYSENEVYGYVSRGTGQWLPFRFGCPPEVNIFILKTL